MSTRKQTLIPVKNEKKKIDAMRSTRKHTSVTVPKISPSPFNQTSDFDRSRLLSKSIDKHEAGQSFQKSIERTSVDKDDVIYDSTYVYVWPCIDTHGRFRFFTALASTDAMST